MEAKKEKFKLALITDQGNPGLKILHERKLDMLFDYDIIDSFELVALLPTPTNYDVCFIMPLDSTIPPAQWPHILAALILKSPKIVWLHCMMAGINLVLSDTLRKATHIKVTNGRGVSDKPLAEFVLLSILFFAKKCPAFLAQKAAHKFQLQVVDNACDSKVAIIGCGSIGRTTAILLKNSINATIFSIRKKETWADTEGIFTYQGFEKDIPYVLAQADYVVNIMPMSSATAKMFNMDMFKRMKPSAVYINLGRGGTTIESDLVTALKTGVIAGAALDVFETEPLPATSPLYEMDNVLVMPHCMGMSIDRWERSLLAFERELDNFMNNKPFSYLVDLEAGY